MEFNSFILIHTHKHGVSVYTFDSNLDQIEAFARIDEITKGLFIDFDEDSDELELFEMDHDSRPKLIFS